MKKAPQSFRALLAGKAAALASKLAKFAGYEAGQPSRTRELHSYFSSNPNSSTSQIERVRMIFTGEYLAKNVPFASAYCETRKIYCQPVRWIANTGDQVLNEEVSEYVSEQMDTGGINCSVWDALERTLDTELPSRGDAGLILYRDTEANRFRFMEFSADQLGELYQFVQPTINRDGTTYFSGIYLKQNGQYDAFKIYERGFNSVYCNPQIYDAQDVIFVKTGPFRGIRGITDFHSAILSIEKGNTFFQAALDSGIKQASREGFIRNMRGQPDELTYETAQNDDGTVTYFQRRMDGTVTEYQFRGDEYQAMEVTMPGEELLKGVKAAKEEACLSLGFPFSFLVNAEAIGGAPSRLEIEKASKKIEQLRRKRLSAINRVAYLIIMDGVNRGDIPAHPLIDCGRWQFPNLPTADAFRDAKADIDALRAGLDSAPRIIARNLGESFETILEENANAALAIAKKAQDLNRKLKAEGYEPTISTMDIAQRTDNPQQAATAEQMERGGVVQKTQEKATFSAFIGDVEVESLPQSVREEIAKHIHGNPMVSRYGMTVPELLTKADQHNLETARRHVRYCTNGGCSDEVHANSEKFVLLMNDRIIDGHHFLAKAEKGKVSKSLQVIDLTPARFQKA